MLNGTKGKGRISKRPPLFKRRVLLVKNRVYNTYINKEGNIFHLL